MKIAFVGKGGAGKTTLSSLFVSYLAELDRPVLAIDADINQHLAAALATPDQLVPAPLGANIPLIKEYLRGDNPRISSASAMVKSTPPGKGSRLLQVVEPNPIYDACVTETAGIRLAATGPFTENDLGVSCYHSKTGAVDLLLNHLVDGQDEYIVVDMTAGADSFASGLFTRFDLTVLVCEPTARGVGVYRQYFEYASDFDVRLAVVGNKVCDIEDETFLGEQVGDQLIASFGRSAHVRAAEKGKPRPINELEPANLDVLAKIKAELDSIPKDWAHYQHQTIQMHIRFANAWGNTMAGADLTQQIDHDFVLGPQALLTSVS